MIIKTNNIMKFILSFVMPIISLTITYFMLGIYPFGTDTLLTIDLNDQYLSFFSYFNDLLHGEANLFYSFSKGMGGEMVGLNTYYLFSPYNLILLFANLNSLPNFVLVITLLKVGTAGLSMYFFLKQSNRNEAALILSFCYSLMGYNIAYQQNIMWLDGVILLPLVIYGIERILSKKSFLTYTLFLSLAIVTNYYIGFMICIFSLFYFITKLFEINKITIRERVQFFLNFTYGSLLSGGLSAFVTVPTLHSFKGGSAGFDIDSLNFTINFNLFDFFSKIYIGSYNFEQLQRGFPNIYVSLFVWVLVVMFFISKNIRKREKITTIILLTILFFSFLISGFDLFWHGLNVPNWYPYRYSFIFSFLLISTASKMLSNYFNDIQKMLNVKLIIISLVFFLLSITISQSSYNYLNNSKIALSILLVIVYCVFLSRIKKNKYQIQFLFIFGMIFCELTLNSYLVLKEVDYDSYEMYQEFIDDNKKIFSQLTKVDQFYRIEKNYHYSQNDPLLFNYNGLSHYSTTSKENEKTLLGKMGYNNQKIWAMYSEGSSIPADSFFGVKYILTDDRSLDYYDLHSIKNGVSIYENPYALPLGFAVSNNGYNIIEYKNPINYQNELFQQISGLNDEIFSEVPDSNIRIQLENVDFKMVKNLYRYGTIDSNEKGTINFYIKNNDRQLINFYFDIIHYDDANIYVDDQFIGKDFNKFSHTINIGSSDKDEIKVTIELLTDQLRYFDANFYYQNNEVFLQNINELNKNTLSIKEINNSSIHGEVIGTDKKNVLLLTIPYDDSWIVKINGENARTKPILDALLSVEIPTGTSKIDLIYKPKGVLLGLIFSIISLIILFLRKKA